VSTFPEALLCSVLLIGKPVPTFPEALGLRYFSRAAATDSHPGEGRYPRKFPKAWQMFRAAAMGNRHRLAWMAACAAMTAGGERYVLAAP